MKKLAVGILAHVDAGKTTLSEAMLYMGGSIRKMGRVDRGDAFLDTSELERKRGITIFSRQAILKWREVEITLLDTPGHVDFSAEMERTLQILDYAVLVVSGTDGVQEHTRTLWRLLARYRVPAMVFINKMDLAELGKGAVLDELRKVLKDTFVDFGEAGTEHFYEQIAMTGEETLDEFLETGTVEMTRIRRAIRNRRLFPCFFGSALKLYGVEEFMTGLEDYTEPPCCPEEFGAKIFKITRDAQGNRMSHMKITGGSLMTREIIDGEKVNQIRIYSGEKFETVREAAAGSVCAVLGLTKAAPGQGLGTEAASAMPLLEPVMTYRILLPEGTDASAVLPRLKELEEEDPELHLTWEESKKEIHVQIMGEIQMEILKSLIAERFGMNVDFGGRSIVYRETIRNTVEGVGHFEPLRHYAEVHLLLEPGEPGSGLQFAADCSEDILGKNWQRLVLTHLAEREHKGVLTGSAVTDMKITLMSGRAHIKHTEGGDFRQAVYRAVRQGLMQADSILLEPFYEFRLELPERMIGRAMSDVERMAGKTSSPLIEGDRAILTGSAPAACMEGYQNEVTAYTGGAGRLSLAFSGYGPCHNTEEVIAAIGYDAEGDTENPSGSVFCAHGAGFQVVWEEVPDYMHLESCLGARRGTYGGGESGAGGQTAEGWQAGGQAGGQKAEGWRAGGRKAEGWQAGGQTGGQKAEGRQADGQTGGQKAEGWQAGGQAGGQKAEGRQTDGPAGGQQVGGRRAEGRKAETGIEAEWIGTEEVDAILERTFYANRRGKAAGARNGWKNREKISGVPEVRTYKKEAPRKEYLLVDGYNIIFAWDELKELAEDTLDGARGRLLDILCNYQGMRNCELIAVFDAYRVQGHETECLDYHNIRVVFTKEAETADQYIERFAHENGRKYDVTVATSDHLEQIIIRGQGCRLISATEFQEEIKRLSEIVREEYQDKKAGEKKKSYLLDSASEEMIKELKELPEE